MENTCNIKIESNGVIVTVDIEFTVDGGMKSSIKFPDEAISNENKAMLMGGWLFNQLTGE